jgi:hypothetical protein
MSSLVGALLRPREAALSPGRLLALIAAGSAAFGAAFGAYVGRFQVLYNAAKMPLFLLTTLALSLAAMHLFAARDLRLRETLAAAGEAVAVTAVVLGALAPVVLLIASSCPLGDPRAYSFLILLLTASVAAAGAAGVARLHARLRSWRLTAAWTAIYQFTGAQAAWLLKPWVSHTFSDDRFLPLRENLKGNFYESVVRTVLGLFS